MNDNVDGRLDQAELDIGQLESEGVLPRMFYAVIFILIIFSKPEQR